jgi:hypothetical protein
MPDAPIDAIKRIAMMDLGQKRKNFKYRVKKGFNIQNSDTRESIFGTTPNVTEFDAEDIEITIDTWLTPGDKVILTINVTNYSYHVFQLSKMHDTVFVYNKNCVGKG